MAGQGYSKFKPGECIAAFVSMVRGIEARGASEDGQPPVEFAWRILQLEEYRLERKHLIRAMKALDLDCKDPVATLTELLKPKKSKSAEGGRRRRETIGQ